MTALPIIETLAGDKSRAHIPTNVIGITMVKFIWKTDLFFCRSASGDQQRCLSVSRVSAVRHRPRPSRNRRYAAYRSCFASRELAVHQLSFGFDKDTSSIPSTANA